MGGASIRAAIPEEFPDNAVAIGSRVAYRLKGIDGALTGTLVLENEVSRCPGSVSIASPVGTALLGLREGDRMPFKWDGHESEVLVERVERAAVDGMEIVSRRGGISAVNSKDNLDRRLDHGLEETFPASDPVSVVCTSTDGR